MQGWVHKREEYGVRTAKCVNWWFDVSDLGEEPSRLCSSYGCLTGVDFISGKGARVRPFLRSFWFEITTDFVREASMLQGFSFFLLLSLCLVLLYQLSDFAFISRGLGSSMSMAGEREARRWRIV